jgi:hypothetical protein
MRHDLVCRPRNNLQYRPDLKSCQTDMLFSERRYADDLPMSYTATRYLGCLARKHWGQSLAWVESQISGPQPH